MHFRLPFVTLLFAMAALGTPVKRDAATVETAIQNVNTQSVALDDDIKAYPSSGGTLDKAFAIHAAASELSDTIKTATNDVNASPDFTDEQSNNILELVNTIIPVVKSSSSHLIAKEPALAAVGVKSIAQSDLQTLKASTDAFGRALVPKLTANAQTAAQKGIDDVDAAISTAIQAYV